MSSKSRMNQLPKGARDFADAAQRRAQYIVESARPHHEQVVDLMDGIRQVIGHAHAATACVALTTVLTSMILELHDDRYDRVLDVAAIGCLLQETLDSGAAEILKGVREGPFPVS